MRRKKGGYIFQFISSDHGGRHIHVFRNDRQVGVYDRVDGPIRGLEKAMNPDLQEGLFEL